MSNLRNEIVMAWRQLVKQPWEVPSVIHTSFQALLQGPRHIIETERATETEVPKGTG